MLATTGPFQAMVEGQDQTLAWSLAMTLPAAAAAYDDVSLAVQSLSIDASTATDAPEGTRLQEGYSSMQATFTLSGLVDITDESKTAGWLFGPYSTTSPLYRSDAFRAPVVIKLGLYPDGVGGVPELLTKFTGYVDEYTVDEDGNVSFTCLDLRANFRGSVTMPAVVTAAPFNAGLTSEYAVGAVLRAATAGVVSSWPKQRPQCLLAAGLRSSIWPEIGTANSGRAVPPSFASGPWGSGLTLEIGSIPWTLTAPVGTVFYVEFLALITGGSDHGIMTVASSDGNTNVVNVDVSSAGVAISVKAGGLGGGTDTWTWAHAVDATPHVIGALISWTGTAWSATAWVDGASSSSGARTSVSARTLLDMASGFAQTSGGGVVAGFQVTSETAPTPSYPFTPQAVLDPSLNPLQLVPAIEGDPWATIQTIAAAELAVAGFDEAGIFRYQNRATIRSKASSRSITSTTSLKSLGISQTAAAVVNRAQIGSTGWTYEAAATTVYSANGPIKVAKYSTKIVRSDLDMFAVLLDGSISKLPNGSTDKVHSFYRASSSKAGVAEHPGGLSFVVSQTAANQLAVTITNASGVDAWLVSPANYTDLTVGTPVLRVGGTNVVQNDEVVADYQFPHAADGGAASTRFGEVLFELTGSPWIQDDDAAAQLAQDIVVDSCVPRPDLTGVAIVPDPRLQLTDVALIQDLDRTGVNEYGRIFASTVTFEAGDPPTYEQSIDARTLAPPGGWIGGVAGRSEGDLTTWGY